MAPLRGVGAYNGRPQGGRGMGPRIREDNGKGESGGGAVPEPPLRGVGRTAYNGRPQGSPLQGKDGGVGEGSPPSPIFTRAGSNLPPSRGKGFVGAERAIFLVMTGCDLGRQLGHGRYQLLHVFFVVEGVGGSSDAGELRHLSNHYAVLVPQSTHCLIRRNAFYLEGG